MLNNKQMIKQALLAHYTAPLETGFKQFKSGAILFGVGLLVILMANAYMTPSAKQEWVILGGLLIFIAGFFIAMLAQMRMMISRFVLFFRKNRRK